MKMYFVGYYATDNMVNAKYRAFTEIVETGHDIFDYYNKGTRRTVEYDGLREYLHLYSLVPCKNESEAKERVREYNNNAQSKGCYAYGAV